MPLFNSKAVLSLWKLRDAAVNFNTYRNLQRHRAVLRAITRLSCKHSAMKQIRMYYKSGTGETLLLHSPGGSTACNDVESPTPSVDAYLFEEHSC